MDGNLVLEREIVSKGARGDRPLIVNVDYPVASGQHKVRVTFVPTVELGSEGKQYQVEFTGDFVLGCAQSVALSRDGTELIHLAAQL